MAEVAAGEGSPEDGTSSYLTAVVEDQFRAHPAVARANGDHSADGLVAQVGADADRQRISQLHQLRDRAGRLPEASNRDLRLDLDTAKSVVDSELFSLQVRRRAFKDPTSLLDYDSPLDVGGYLLRDYAPLPDRLTALCKQLEQAPEWIEEALGLLEPELAAPLIQLALQGAEGHLSFLGNDVTPIGEEIDDAGLRRRLGDATRLGQKAITRVTAELEKRKQTDVQDIALGQDGLRANAARPGGAGSVGRRPAPRGR